MGRRDKSVGANLTIWTSLTKCWTREITNSPFSYETLEARQLRHPYLQIAPSPTLILVDADHKAQLHSQEHIIVRAVRSVITVMPTSAQVFDWHTGIMQYGFFSSGHSLVLTPVTFLATVEALRIAIATGPLH